MITRRYTCVNVATLTTLLALGACTAGAEQGDVMSGLTGDMMDDTSGTGGMSAGPVSTQPMGMNPSATPTTPVGTGGSAPGVGGAADPGTQPDPNMMIDPDPNANGGAGGMASIEPEVIGPDFNANQPFRFEVPCLFDENGQDATGSYCHPSNVCWLTSTKSNEMSTENIPMGGDPAKTYNITLRIRGVIEPKRYADSCEQLESDQVEPDLRICKGTADEGPSTFDTWQLKIDEPLQYYYMNSENEGHGHAVFTIDTQFVIQAKGQTKITFLFDDINGGLISNCPELTFPELEDQPYNGNWMQLDVVEWDMAE
jgi:hypothetical protein